MNTSLGTFTIIISLVVEIFLIIGIYSAVKYFKIGEKLKNSQLSNTEFNKILNIVSIVVNSYNQTMVNSLKDSNSDGKLSEVQGCSIFNTVKKMIVSSLSQSQYELIELYFGDFDEGIKHLIENAVNINKTSSLNSLESMVEFTPDHTNGFNSVDIPLDNTVENNTTSDTNNDSIEIIESSDT